MKIQFDQDTKIAGIGLVPWTRLGPERWLKDFRIASLYGWDLHDLPGVPKVHSLSDSAYGMPALDKLNSQHLVDSPQFQQMVISELPGYSFLTYKPVVAPEALLRAGCRFMGLKKQKMAAILENKAEFRKIFADTVHFPPYQIISRSEVKVSERDLQSLLAGREKIVVQDEKLGGGRGTYMVRTLSDLRYALESIEKLGGGDRLVVSEFVAGVERSVQACATRFGTFVGPLQKQIIADPLLSNLSVPEGDKFCGAEISHNDAHAGAYQEIRQAALAIGEQVSTMGYRGIFSVDCLVDAEGRVFVLEINPRITGITPLLSMLYRGEQDIPFYLLHILELAGIDYQITETEVDPVPQEGSLMILHATSQAPTHIIDSPSSGIYSVDAQEFIRPGYRLDLQEPSPQLLVQRYTPPGFTVKPGGRLVTSYVNRPVLDKDDNLTPQIKQMIRHLLDRIELQEF